MSKYEFDEFDVEDDTLEEYYKYLERKNDCSIDFVISEMKENLNEWFVDNKINEIRFSELLTDLTSLKCIDDSFYNINGFISENEIKNNIQKIISTVITTRVSNSVNAIFGTLKNYCFLSIFKPQDNKIHLKNGTITINNGGYYFEKNKEFTTNRLNVSYQESDDKPVKWLNYLNSLFNDEDIEILQEYLGYCLLPTLKGQKALFIIGKGGEGKSVLGKVITDIFGTSLSSDKIHSLFDGKFGLSNINMKLIIYDDDLMAYQLKDTALFKTLVTGGKIQYEKKFVNKTELEPYARFIACGNQMLQAASDESKGFKRRLLILLTKEKDVNRKDDPFLFEKLIIEKDLIFKWALNGLIRLLSNNYVFSYSKEMENKVEYLVTNDSTKYIYEYLNNTDYILYNPSAFTSTIDLYNHYLSYCKNINIAPISETIFNKKLAVVSKDFEIERGKSIIDSTNKEIRGYHGIKIVDID